MDWKSVICGLLTSIFAIGRISLKKSITSCQKQPCYCNKIDHVSAWYMLVWSRPSSIHIQRSQDKCFFPPSLLEVTAFYVHSQHLAERFTLNFQFISWGSDLNHILPDSQPDLFITNCLNQDEILSWFRDGQSSYLIQPWRKLAV